MQSPIHRPALLWTGVLVLPPILFHKVQPSLPLRYLPIPLLQPWPSSLAPTLHFIHFQAFEFLLTAKLLSFKFWSIHFRALCPVQVWTHFFSYQTRLFILTLLFLFPESHFFHSVQFTENLDLVTYDSSLPTQSFWQVLHILFCNCSCLHSHLFVLLTMRIYQVLDTPCLWLSFFSWFSHLLSNAFITFPPMHPAKYSQINLLKEHIIIYSCSGTFKISHFSTELLSFLLQQKNPYLPFSLPLPFFLPFYSFRKKVPLDEILCSHLK